MCVLLTVVAVSVYASPVRAQAIITSGDISLGINPQGNLNVPTGTGGSTINPYNTEGFVGLFYAPINGDGTAPGCLCEGFGVSANGISGHADVDRGGVVNLTVDSFTHTATTATSMTHLTSLSTLSITQAYSPSSSSNLFVDHVTLTNSGASALTDVRYNRTMDWDIPPTTFDELVTIQGWPATALICTGDDGFQTPNPLEACDSIDAPLNSNFSHNPPGGDDHGARFTFGFGSLAAGESRSFDIFYGAAPNEAMALAALSAVGAEVYSFGQCTPGGEGDGGPPCGPGDGSPATFMFGFAGVGGTPIPPGGGVPEPASLTLLGTGVLGLLARRKLRRNR
jgi:type IV pilus assembly protein PilY1